MVAICNYLFGFCQGRSIAEAMFILRMIQENKKLYRVFVDL